MRAAVESRRLVQLNGVNADRVVSVAWAASSFLAGLSGVLLAPYFPQANQSQAYITLMVGAIAVAASASLRSLPLAALFGILLGVASLVLQGYLPTQSIFYSSILPSLPFIVLVFALLFNPGLKKLDDNKDPLASWTLRPATCGDHSDSPGAALHADRVVFAAAVFIVSMLTWMPRNWENVFNSGLAFATVFLSITLITGMGGQLSLAQGTLAGVGAFTAAQLANHLGLNMVFGMLIGAGVAAVVAILLAVLSLRLKGLGLALMTLAAALFFDSSIFPLQSVSGGQVGSTCRSHGWHR